MSGRLAFIPGQPQPHPLPLSRYLPRLPMGIATAWLQNQIPVGKWVIDPFGASPDLVIEAARAGYRVIVAANNPIAQFLIEMAAMPPTKADLQSALAELASERRGKERLELHILDLYRTTCDDCKASIIADRFVWEKDGEFPIAKVYTCPHCNSEGEYKTTEEDKARAGEYQHDGPSYARALERVATADDPNRVHVEEALENYLPRAVYALFTLINKFNGLSLDEQKTRNLSALLLAACDRASTLWPTAGERRPRQLGVPSRFYEHNIWLALERAIELWGTEAPPVPLTYWPEQPPESGGIVLYEGRLKFLATQLDTIPISGGISALPRPNQAYWTLSALWAGWIWGRDAIGAFTTVLNRRRYDWAWHTTALQNNFKYLTPHLTENTPFFGIITESEPGFDAATIIAAELAGLELTSITTRVKQGISQIAWQKSTQSEPQTTTPQERIETMNNAAQGLLQRLGEPTQYLTIHNAAIAALAHKYELTTAEKNAAEQFTDIRAEINSVFDRTRGFARLGGSDKDPNTGRWWLQDEAGVAESLSDRVEKFIVKNLIESPGQTSLSLDRNLCAAFPGLTTPPQSLLTAVLNSYAKETDGKWNLLESDSIEKRNQDAVEIKSILWTIGERLGFHVSGEKPVVWKNDEQEITLYIVASTVLSEILLQPPPQNGLIILPGSRAHLLLDKFNHDPRLKTAANHWQFVKYRMIRRMATNINLSTDIFFSQLSLDPLSEENTQLPLL